MRGQMETDQRKWHLDKGIPVALLMTIAGALFLGGVAYQSLKSDIVILQNTQKEMRDESKNTVSEVRSLSGKLQEGSIPSAQNAWRIAQVESAIVKQDARNLALEARVAENERKLLRSDNAAASTNARLRAQGDR
jgi:hypothetical protein